MRILPVLVPIFVASLSLPARADVLVVDWRGGPRIFKTIQAAVNAAKTGDTILIRAGGYDELVTISGKALTILGEGPAPPDVVIGGHVWHALDQRGLRFIDHPAGRTSRVARLQIGPIFLNYRIPPGLEVRGAGNVVLDDVVSAESWSIGPLQGALLATGCIVDDNSHTEPAPALALTQVEDAILVGCGVRGRAGTNAWMHREGVATVRIDKSNVEMMGSIIVGMDSPRWHWSRGKPGNGIDLIKSKLLLTASRVTGGNGDPWYEIRGADGISLLSSSLRYSDSKILGGTGKPNGVPIRKDSASHVRAVNQPVALRRNTVFRVGKTTTISIRGLAGQPTITLFGSAYAHISVGFGVLRIDPSTLLVSIVAVLDRNGSAKLPFSLARVHPFYVGSPLLAQTLALDAAGKPSLSTPLTSIVLW